jgi:hypothetical protein
MRRLPAVLALAVPVLAGIGWMAWAGAPPAFLAVNAGALAGAMLWLGFGRLPTGPSARRTLAIALIVLFALPLVTGPQVNEIARWLPLGPFPLHAGMLALPLLLVLAAGTGDDAAPLLLAGLFVALLQPDAASAFAITFACVGLHHVGQDWRMGLVAIAGFFTAIAAALRGELAAQPFVERVLVSAALDHPLAAIGLFAALTAGFLLMLFAVPLGRAERFALAGTLFGFSVTAMMSNYPSALIGFGAAPILGYALALSARLEEEPIA